MTTSCMMILLVAILHCDKISIPNKDFLKDLSLNPNGIFKRQLLRGKMQANKIHELQHVRVC